MISEKKIVQNSDMITYIRLWSTQLELNDGDLGLFHTGGATRRDHNILIKNNTFHEFGVFYSTANLLDNTDVSEVHI